VKIRRALVLSILVAGIASDRAAAPARASTARDSAALSADPVFTTSDANGESLRYVSGPSRTTIVGQELIMLARPGNSAFCQTGYTCASLASVNCPTTTNSTAGLCDKYYSATGGYTGEADVLNADPSILGNHVVHGYTPPTDSSSGEVIVTLTGLPRTPTRLTLYYPTARTTPYADQVVVCDLSCDFQNLRSSGVGSGILAFFDTSGSSQVQISIHIENGIFAAILISAMNLTAVAYDHLFVRSDHGVNRVSWRSTRRVLGFQVFDGSVRLNHQLVTSSSWRYEFATRHRISHLRILAVPADGSW